MVRGRRWEKKDDVILLRQCAATITPLMLLARKKSEVFMSCPRYTFRVHGVGCARRVPDDPAPSNSNHGVQTNGIILISASGTIIIRDREACAPLLRTELQCVVEFSRASRWMADTCIIITVGKLRLGVAQSWVHASDAKTAQKSSRPFEAIVCRTAGVSGRERWKATQKDAVQMVRFSGGKSGAINNAVSHG